MASEPIELALASMKLGEHSTIKIKKQENIELEISLEIIRFGNMRESKWDWIAEERIENAIKFKNDGNELIKAQNFEQAEKKYKLAEEVIQRDTGSNVENVKKSLYSNLALTTMKTNKFEQTLFYTKNVLENEPKNVKILYRKAVALSMTGNHHEAITCLNEALSIDPQNVEIINEMKNVKDREINAQKNEKKMYSKMFQ